MRDEQQEAWLRTFSAPSNLEARIDARESQMNIPSDPNWRKKVPSRARKTQLVAASDMTPSEAPVSPWLRTPHCCHQSMRGNCVGTN